MKIQILCEDSYARDFFSKLINRLKEESKVSQNLTVKTDRIAGVCNSKTKRQVAAASASSERIIIIVDADGRLMQDIEIEVLDHVPEQIRGIVRMVILQYEIEEWLCVDMGIQFTDGCKPSDKLKYEIGYEKFKLPSFANKLDLSALKRRSKSFTRFVKCLGS